MVTLTYLPYGRRHAEEVEYKKDNDTPGRLQSLLYEKIDPGLVRSRAITRDRVWSDNCPDDVRGAECQRGQMKTDADEMT